MPKMKSKTGAKKRFKLTGTGKFKHGKRGRRHLLTHKPTKRKRRLRGGKVVDKAQHHQIKAMLPHAG